MAKVYIEIQNSIYLINKENELIKQNNIEFDKDDVLLITGNENRIDNLNFYDNATFKQIQKFGDIPDLFVVDKLASKGGDDLFRISYLESMDYKFAKDFQSKILYCYESIVWHNINNIFYKYPNNGLLNIDIRGNFILLTYFAPSHEYHFNAILYKNIKEEELKNEINYFIASYIDPELIESGNISIVFNTAGQNKNISNIYKNIKNFLKQNYDFGNFFSINMYLTKINQNTKIGNFYTIHEYQTKLSSNVFRKLLYIFGILVIIVILLNFLLVSLKRYNTVINKQISEIKAKTQSLDTKIRDIVYQNGDRLILVDTLYNKKLIRLIQKIHIFDFDGYYLYGYAYDKSANIFSIYMQKQKTSMSTETLYLALKEIFKKEIDEGYIRNIKKSTVFLEGDTPMVEIALKLSVPG